MRRVVGFLCLLALDSDGSNKRMAGVEVNLGQLVLSAAHTTRGHEASLIEELKRLERVKCPAKAGGLPACNSHDENISSKTSLIWALPADTQASRGVGQENDDGATRDTPFGHYRKPALSSED